MSWFSFYSTLNSSGQVVTQTPVQKFPPVRRRIVFPTLNENLKIGDWIYVPLGDLQVGKLFAYDNGIVSSTADDDSYLVVYENNNQYQPTYSYIDNENNLYFRSVTAQLSGSSMQGSYYVYYHHNNIQFLSLINGQYVQPEIGIQGFQALEQGNISSPNVINKYSNLVLGTSANDRVYSLSYISSPGIWVNQESNNPGNKVIGNFDGPNLKIFGKKSPDSGKISIKIIKTSSSGNGQSVLYTDTVDLYSPTTIEEIEIYSTDVSQKLPNAESEELYGAFMFEIEILNDKNISSSGKKIKIIKYSFSKNYFLSIDDEEIYEGIVFTSSGVIR